MLIPTLMTTLVCMLLQSVEYTQQLEVGSVLCVVTQTVMSNVNRLLLRHTPACLIRDGNSGSVRVLVKLMKLQLSAERCSPLAGLR